MTDRILTSLTWQDKACQMKRVLSYASKGVMVWLGVNILLFGLLVDAISQIAVV